MCGKNKNFKILSIATFIFFALSLLHGTANATSGVSPDISFEGKIVNSSGVNITNGTYNIEFTMYSGCTNEPTNNTGCTLAWTEDYLTSGTEGVAISGGTFAVNLGQYCSFAGGSCQGNTNTGINWNTYPIYMSMQIGGTTNCTPAGNFTTNCSGDGVMQPYILMTSTPYAQNSAALGGLSSSAFAQLAIGSQTFTGSNTFANSSTGALVVQNAGGVNTVLDVDTTDSIVSVGALATPGTLTATQAPIAGSLTGTAGTTSYTYEITAVSANGAESLASTETNASLAASITTNHITINWTTNGAAYYKIYRTASAGSPNSLGLVGTSTTSSFVDTGYTAGAQPPALANTGTLAVSTTYYYEVTALDDTYTTGGSVGQTSPSAQLTAITNTYNKSLTINWAPVSGARAYNVYRTTTNGVYTTDSYYTVYTNSFTDTNATATGTNTVPPTVSTAYGNALSNNATANVTIGSSGTSTAQLYVGGSVPTTSIGSVVTGSGSRPSGVAVQGNYTYVSNYGTSTFQVYDTSNPASPTLVGSTALTGGDGIAISGNYAYVVDFSTNYLYIVNISNPTNPVIVGDAATGTNPAYVYVQGRYAYVVNWNNGSSGSTLEVFDLSNPTNPVLVGAPVATGIGAYDVDVQGNYAYVTNIDSNTLQIFNVSNPASIPAALSTVTTGTDPNALYVQGRYAYVVDTSSDEMQVFDVSNPSNVPAAIATFTTASDPNGITIQGRYAYIAEYTTSVQTVDISNPADPLNVGTVGTGTGTNSGEASNLIVVQGRYAYMISDLSSNNLQIFDIGGAYVQQLQTGGIETGTLQVDDNANVSGSESVTGGLQVGSSAQIAGDLGVYGRATVTSSTNSATAFQVDNAVGSPILLVSTIGNNLLTYPGFEAGSFTSDTTGWQAVGTGTISQNSTKADTYNGLYSLELVTTTTAGAGAQTDAFTGTVAAGTYDVSFYAYPSVAMNANAFTVTLDDTTTHTCSPAAATLSTVGFTLLNCSVTITGNLTYLSITQNDTTARTIYIDAVQLQTGVVATPYSIGSIQFRGPVSNPVTFEAASNSTTAFQVLTASNANLLNIDSLDGIVEVGSISSTNTTQTLLQLNSDNTFTEAATCSTTTNQGALYYNNASNNVRACINGTWQDLVSTAGLAQLLFGVVPNSGPVPGDIEGADGNQDSPCKVYWVSATAYGVAACQAYSGGREISYAGTASVTVTGMTTTNIYENLCFNSSGVLTTSTAVATDGTGTANLTAGTTIGAPLLCIATLKGSATTANHLASIYDIRTFTTTTKTYATITSATQILGGLVDTSANGIVAAPAVAATANLEGVIVAGTGASSAGAPNILIATAGPQWVKTTAATEGQYAEDGATAGYVTGSGTVGTTFDDLGVAQITAATSCTTNTLLALTNCQFSTLVNINIH